MKHITMLLALAVVALAASTALAYVPPDYPPTGGPGGWEQDTGIVEWINGAWVAVDGTQVQGWRAGTAWTYFCNGEYVNEATGEVEVKVAEIDLEASVAQYLEARLTKTYMTWYVLKPHRLVDLAELDRDFSFDSIGLEIKSNGQIIVESEPITNLINTVKPDANPIPVQWALTQGSTAPLLTDPIWAGAGDSISLVIPEDYSHPLMTYKVWNTIHTGKCTSACNYETSLKLYIVLDEQKSWLIDKISLPTRPRVDD